MSQKNPQRVLGVFTISMLSVSAILNLRNIPFMASLGMKCIFFYALAAIFFFLPSAFVCAELSTRAENNGGVYSWVKTAFGEKIGFIAIWMEWINNVIGFPATLSTIIATATYILFPHLMDNKLAFFSCMMLVFWGCTLYNFSTIKVATALNIVGALLGTILPGALIIVLGLVWVSKGSPLAITDFSIVPKLSGGNFTLFIGAMSSYSGMQILAFHAKNVQNPKQTFPRAIFLGGLIILILSILASLSVAIVVPHGDLNIINGIIEGFSYFFTAFHLSFLVRPLALCLVIGSVASLSAWMLGPARAISVAARDELLPKLLGKRNKNDMPVPILITQGIIGTLLASLFLFIPSMQLAFWILVALTSQFSIFMYILIFAASIKLRYLEKEKTGYHIPGGNRVLWIVALTGILTCCIGFIAGIIPPDLSKQGFTPLKYIFLIISGDALIIALPIFWINLIHKKA